MKMPLRMKDNTKYPPVRIKDLVYRNTTPGIESFIPEDIQLEIKKESQKGASIVFGFLNS